MNYQFLRNVLLKALGLFLAFNLLFAAWQPAGLGRLSIYNRALPGRERFPFGENPAVAYNLSLFDLDAMFASHVIDGSQKAEQEFRIILVGDSSVWGTLLRPDQTLSGQLNAADLSVCGKGVRVFNLGYPTISLTKDLLVLDQAMRYQPDLVIWPLTLEAFPLDKQLTSPIVANNPERVGTLIEKYSLPFDPLDPALVQLSFWERTIVGQRRPLADLIRLQLYGVMWAATGIDQTYPADYPRAQLDFEADESFHGMQPPSLDESQLAFEILEAGLQAAGDTPVLLVNEPMLVSSGENSHLRYNFFYPRWAYDQFRQQMASLASQNGWNYLDLWDLLPDSQNYTNSAIHLTPAGESILAGRIAEAILKENCP